MVLSRTIGLIIRDSPAVAVRWLRLGYDFSWSDKVAGVHRWGSELDWLRWQISMWKPRKDKKQ